MSSLPAPNKLVKSNPSSSITPIGSGPGAEEGEKPRYEEGWRRGKPVEDPAKLKRWGFVTAKPSEYLVSVKEGRIDLRRSGQGMRVWKWPWQAVAIIPTTLQQLEFVADQITRERVGVQVTGIAVYRIAHPEIAYRMRSRAKSPTGKSLHGVVRKTCVAARSVAPRFCFSSFAKRVQRFAP